MHHTGNLQQNQSASRGRLLAHHDAAFQAREGDYMSFGLYIVGFIVLIVGLAWGAHLAHVPQQWIGVGVVVLVGLGIVSAVTHTRQRDSN